MCYKLGDDDYLDLWEYFQSRADDVKEAMFTSVTWSIGFSTAILGYIIYTLVNPIYFKVFSPRALVVTSIIGFLLCIYTYILVHESRKHIRRNWEHANDCRRRIEGLDALLKIEKPEQELRPWYSLSYVWNQVLCINGAFALIFLGLIVWALAGSGA
jgi:hypothetical protein